MEKENNQEMRSLLEQSQNIIERLQSAINDMRPMAEFAEAVIADETHYSMKEAADVIAEKLVEQNIKIGRNKLFGVLRDIGILCASDNYWNEPYRKFIDAGYFFTKLKETNVGMKSVTLVTGKGVKYIFEKVMDYYGIG
jgi:anti-repressor protein